MTVSYLKKGGLAAFVLAAMALVAAAFWQSEGATARALADHGMTAQAYIVQKQPLAGGETFEVTYAYQSVAADGSRRTHRIAHEVPQAVFETASVGGTVEVRYLPEDPATASVHPGEHTDGRTFLDVLALVAAAAAAVASLTGLGLARRAPMAALPA